VPSAEQEREFFNHIKLSNGTFKVTSAGRLDDLNLEMIKVWHEFKSRPVELMDVGVSSGITTMEWLEMLRRCGADVRIVATDLQLSARLVRLLPGCDVLLDCFGNPLQYSIGRLAVRPWNKNIDIATGFAVIREITKALYRIISRLRPPQDGQDVLLISRRFEHRDEITFCQDDVMGDVAGEFVRRFQVVRVANLLNRAYFSEELIRKAVSNLRRRLAGDGSFLIVNRTHADGRNHGTIFRLSREGSFEVRSRIGMGSEIEPIVLNLEPEGR
jgi:hypothetical protein